MEKLRLVMFNVARNGDQEVWINPAFVVSVGDSHVLPADSVECFIQVSGGQGFYVQGTIRDTVSRLGALG